jgi:adenosylcobyric acid synthase
MGSATVKEFANPHTIMVQGTTSDAGKSILVTALCRILVRNGVAVAPFKSQNMALNSAVTKESGEIGRAQAVQAQAAKLEPSILMNPVLLKPNSDVGSQVIVNGQSIGNMKAREYHEYKPQLLKQVVATYQQLQALYPVTVIEGAGSPAEINLREHDIANMGFAEAIDCPVLIIADIDRGGVFAHLYGTYALLSESEQQRVSGFIINRFRGDVSLLQSGLDWLEKKTGVPTVAVIPYITNLHIEAEDAVNQTQIAVNVEPFKIVVPLYPRASNHTDFDVLRLHPQLDCEFVRDAQLFNGADLIILPGSKNVGNDLQWLKDTGWQPIIERHLRFGGKVLGICGGYQMLGKMIHDPKGIENEPSSSTGLGLLNIETTLDEVKTLTNVTGQCLHTNSSINAYEIHAGVSDGDDLSRPWFSIRALGKEGSLIGDAVLEGAANSDDSVRGTYLHGLLEGDDILKSVLDWAGMQNISVFDYQAFREQQIERLADEVEQALSFAALSKLLSLDATNTTDANAEQERTEGQKEMMSVV